MQFKRIGNCLKPEIVPRDSLRLLLVVDVFPPARTAAAVQMHALASALCRLGHGCAVLTPNDQILGRFEVESDNAFTILRIRSAPLKRINLARRAMNEMLLSSHMWAGYKASPMVAEHWDGVVFYSPSIFFGRFVEKLKAQHRCKAYLILRDIFPDWAAEMGVMRKGPPYWLFRAYAAYQYGIADVIGVESSHNRKYIGPREGRAEVLNNWIDIDGDPAPTFTLPKGLQGRKVFVYAGNMGVAQDMDNLLRLAQRLAGREDTRFLFVGSGTERERVENEVSRLQIGNVVLHPEVDPLQLRGLLRCCHVALISLDRRLRTHNTPGKLLAYLEAGLPVLCSLNPGNELKAIIERNEAGLACWNGDDEGLVSSALQMLDNEETHAHMASNAQRLCVQRFSAVGAANQIARSFSSLSSGQTADA